MDRSWTSSMMICVQSESCSRPSSMRKTIPCKHRSQRAGSGKGDSTHSGSVNDLARGRDARVEANRVTDQGGTSPARPRSFSQLCGDTLSEGDGGDSTRLRRGSSQPAVNCEQNVRTSVQKILTGFPRRMSCSRMKLGT